MQVGLGCRGATFGTFIFLSTPFLEFCTEGLIPNLLFSSFWFEAAYGGRSVDA